MEEKVFTLAELEKMTGNSRRVLRKWCKGNVFPNARKEKRGWVVPKKDLTAFLEEWKETMVQELQKVNEAIDRLGSSEARSPRKEIQTSIEFTPDFGGIIQAKGIDISEHGIGFEIKANLPFAMQFEMGDQLHTYRAHLVWMQSLPNGLKRLGFEFEE